MNAALVFALMGPAAAWADAASDARKQIQQAYDRANAAAARRDASVALAQLAPDYVFTNVQGQTHTAAQMRQAIPRLLAAMKSIKAATKITNFTLKGKEADVVIKEHVEMSVHNPRTGKLTKIVVDETSRTLWVKTSASWKKKRSRALTTKATVDGKPPPTPNRQPP